MEPAEENALLDRARAGDEAAFGALVQAHYPTVFRRIHAILRNEQDARDVAQEVWVQAWRQLRTFRGDAKLSTWLHTLATRRAIDHLRKRRRWFDRFLPFASAAPAEADDPPPAGAPEPVETGPDPRARLETVEQTARFERALAALPPKLRAVLALREIEGLSYEQIAQALGCRPGTVMSRLYHARRQLLKKLGGIDS